MRESKPNAELLLSLLWQQSDHAIVLLDVHGTIVGWRGAAEGVLGFSEAEALGQPISLIFTTEDARRGAPELERTIAEKVGRAEDDRWHVRKDGTRIWIAGSLVSLREDGRLVGFAKLMRDRTDLRVETERARNRLDSLEVSLASRDAALARIAHDVRNALASMSNATEILARTCADEGTRFPVAVLKRQLRVVQRLAADLVTVAQARGGKIRLVLQALDLAAEVKEICQTVDSRMQAKRQELVVITPSVPMPMQADRERLHQIVFNLLDNAIKYTPEDRRIWVKLTEEAGYAVLRVQDEGVGMPPELLPAIFDLFTQEQAGESGDGFGVGLAIVRDLAAAHGGVAEARSEGKGKGSEFAVRLPLDRPSGG